MKKYVALMLALLLALSFVACAPSSGQSGTAPTSGSTPGSTANPSGNSSQTDPTQAPSTTKPTTAPSTAPTTPPSTVPTGTEAEKTEFKATVLHDDTNYEFRWTQVDDTKGFLTVAMVLTASAEEMEGMGLSGSLIYKPEICTYEVRYTKTATGVYTATGNIVSVAASVEGESAEAFVQMMKQSLGDSKLDEMTRRVLDGEVLTEKEEIEWLIWEYDAAMKVVFSLRDGEMVITEVEKTYTSWGFMLPTKEKSNIESGVVRRYEEYEQNALARVTEYRENGVIEKCTYYTEGEATNEVYYDENGEPISKGESKE